MDVAKLLAKAKEKKEAIKSREKTLKPKPGANHYVILPDWKTERNEVFYREFGQHFVKDANDDLKAVHMCLSKTYQQDCPICNALADAAHHVTDDSQVKMLEAAKSKQTYLLNVLECDADGKHDGQPKILEVGYTVFGGILDLMEDWGEAIFQDHQIITVNREGTGFNTKYNVLPKGTKKAVVNTADVYSRLNDLDDYVNQANEDKKRLSINTVRGLVGLSESEAAHIPADRAIGTSAPSRPATAGMEIDDADFTEVRANEASRPDVAQIDIDDELNDLLMQDVG